jgi:hypothetical protein
MLSMEFAFEVRPELLQDIGRHVDAELHTKLGYGVASGPAVRVLGGRDCHCGRVFRTFPNN